MGTFIALDPAAAAPRRADQPDHRQAPGPHRPFTSSRSRWWPPRSFVVLSQVIGPLWARVLSAHLAMAGTQRRRRRSSRSVYTWIEIGRFKVELALRLDTLSAVMTLIITFVGTLIHIYSTGYMAHEPRYAAYFGYLNLFMASMLILVLGANVPGHVHWLGRRGAVLVSPHWLLV